MGYVSEAVQKDFKERESKVLALILASGIPYEEIGIFGSYARNEYKATSDIDFVIITDIRPDRRTSGSLREEAEMLRADIVYAKRNYFEKSEDLFARNLRRDYRRIA